MMSQRLWACMGSLILIAALIFIAGCDDDVGLQQWEPVIEEPDHDDPRIEGPEVMEREAWVDQFYQRDAALDILWVVDVTESMSDHLVNIQENFHRFINVLDELELDFQLGMTTTDLSPDGGGGRLIGSPPVLTPQDDLQQFMERTNRPFQVGAEESFESARRVVESGLHGFPRHEAMLAIIALTDEDDKSPGSQGFYERAFLGLKGPGNHDLIRFSAIAGDLPDGCVDPEHEHIIGAGADPAERIHAMVVRTGGVFGSVCDKDYGPALDEIGLESAGLRRVFPLSHRADPSQGITVEVDEEEIVEDPAEGWRYDEPTQSIRFDGNYIPPAATVIHVRYRVTS